MSGHTPGPWTIKYETNVGAARSGCDWAVVAATGAFSTNTDSGEHDTENKANARLIAAAPELLAALEEILSGYTGLLAALGHDTPSRTDLIRAEVAIAKAKGAP
jgi:hypothetical protein